MTEGGAGLSPMAPFSFLLTLSILQPWHHQQRIHPRRVRANTIVLTIHPRPTVLAKRPRPH